MNWIRERPAITAFAVAALVFGLYARVKGLGTWPLAVDEYYIVRSVENILRDGLPAFPCGGYYARALLYQYLVAPLMAAGVSGELAARIWSVIASITALPAVFLLGRRIHSPLLGVLAVMLLAVSIWEVEMARFGRMYAPFQAVFLWYMVCFLRYAVDRDRKALVPMLALSVIGPLVWEGGIFMALANLLPPFIRHPDGRFGVRGWRYFGCTLLLLVAIFVLVGFDVRMLGAEPALPEAFERIVATEASARETLRASLLHHPAWLAAFALLAGLAVFVALRFRRPGDGWLVLASMACLLAAGLLFQAIAVVLIAGLMTLTGTVDWRRLISRAALPVWGALLAAGGFWTAFGWATTEWRNGAWLSQFGVLRRLLLESTGFPDILQEVILPWARVVPVLGGIMLVLVLCALVRTVCHRDRDPLQERRRAVQIVFWCMVVAVGSSGTFWNETRYTFFAYPLALIISLWFVFDIAQKGIRNPRIAEAVACGLAIGGFALAGDFSWRHLAAVDSPEVNFRIGMTDAQARHYYPRYDVRGAAKWLQQNAQGSDEVVVNYVAGVDYYYAGIDYVFLEMRESRFSGWSCRRGTVERWGGRPLLSTLPAFERVIAGHERTYLVTHRDQVKGLSRQLSAWNPEVVWTSVGGHLSIMRFVRPPAAVAQPGGEAAEHG